MAVKILEDNLQAGLAELRSRLALAEEDLVGRIPYGFRRLLLEHANLENDDGARDWASAVADEILRQTTGRPAREMNDSGSLSARAFCPLCGNGSTNLYGELGFAYPEGLRRHLLGENTAHECAVMKAAREMARDASLK